MIGLNDKFAVFFFTLIVVGMGYLGYQHMADVANCKQSAISKNYSAEQIKTICR